MAVLIVSKLLTRVAWFSAICAWLSLGLGLGLLGSEAYFWAKLGVSPAPHLMDALFFAGFRLPWASWVGCERVLEWAFTQSVCLCAGLGLSTMFLCFGAAALIARGTRSFLVRRHLSRFAAVNQPSRVSVASFDLVIDADSPRVELIRQAYDRLDRRTYGH